MKNSSLLKQRQAEHIEISGYSVVPRFFYRLFNINDYNEAINDYTTVIEIEPGNANVYY